MNRLPEIEQHAEYIGEGVLRVIICGRQAVLLRIAPGGGPLSRLTPAEENIALMAIQGCSNSEIAEARGSSERTVETQLYSVFQKSGVSSRTGLAAKLTGKNTTFDLWPEFLNGQWELIEQLHTGTAQYYLLAENRSPDPGRTELSSREQQVATYAAQGYMNKEIAYRLELTVSTVATHLASAVEKLNLSSRTDLAMIYGKMKD